MYMVRSFEQVFHAPDLLDCLQAFHARGYAMTILCRRCGKPFREEDEIRGLFTAYWHELASRVNYSISRPHDCDRSTLEHVDCEELTNV